MNTAKMPLSALRRPERNVRMHTDKQLKEFERSITMFGQIRPIVVDENCVILAGNGLFETLKRMGRTEADVLKINGLSENQKKKLMLADNKIFGLGVDDLSVFDAFLEELKGDLDIPGFDEDLLQSMVAEADAVSERLQEYGTLDEREIESIRAARERKESAIAAASAVRDSEETAEAGTSDISDGQDSAAAESKPDTMPDDGGRETIHRSVICPHCGGVVWL